MKSRIYSLLIICLICTGCVQTVHSQPLGKQIARPHEEKIPVAKAIKPESPKLKRLKNGHYRVIEPWTVQLNGKVWRVEAGYQCNGITAPKAIKQALGDGVDKSTTWAAVFHDWLFTQPGMTRNRADRLFYDLMIAYRVPKEKAKLMHTSVQAYTLSKIFR
ncbi:MAG: DUF1353 domain-containing protein [Akkermansiaceae bacterium]|nr:DUF1353 domain-containing protein [Akkermansiaceae bacterium]NJR42515.1 DUF1353 domain-containing protein [Akkermansiaceae bacterium]